MVQTHTLKTSGTEPAMCTKLEKKHDPIDQDAARTLDGQRPIGTAKPWISPRRPNRRSKAVDSADDDFYCPDCDWQQYYCLCAAATSVDGAEYWEMAARRAQETGLYGFEHGRERRGLRATVDRRPTTVEAEEEKTDDDGASSVGRSQVVSTTDGDGSVDGRTVAVDEGGDGRSSVGTALEGEIALATTSQGVVGAGGDDGRTSVGRQANDDDDDDDVLLMRRPTTTTSWQTTHAGDWTDEELAEFAESFDAGDVRVCCQWTAHRRYTQEDEDDMEANPHEWERKCCVWIRRGERGDSSEEESSSLLGKRRSSNSDDDDEEETEDEEEEEDWTQPWDADEVPDDDDRSSTPIPDVALQSEPLSVKLGRRPYRSPYSWRSPSVGGILYTTMTTTTPRRSRRLSAKEDADWTRRAQAAIDEEAALDDRIRDAEEELRRRVEARVECERRLERLSLLPKRRRILVRSRYFATSGKTATTATRRQSSKKKTTK